MRRASLALLLAMSLPHHALAQQLVVLGLKQGMPYDEARRVVMSQGWQADINNPTRLTELQVQLQSYFLQRGFTEAEECLPTGLGTCRTSFHNADGQTLYLFTSEPEGAQTSIVSWCLGSRKRDCRR